MMHSIYPVEFVISQEQEEQHIGNLLVEKNFIEQLYQEIVSTHQLEAHTFGFLKGKTPRSYIEENYKTPIYEHLQEFIFFHCLINALYHEIRQAKLVLIGDPNLSKISIHNLSNPSFEFTFTKVILSARQNWKSLAFKPAERKNYKDLDKQVESFIKEEDLLALTVTHKGIKTGDWVCFSMALVNNNHEALLGSYKNILWLKIGEEDIDLDARDIFLGKQIGDTFYNKSIFFQRYISTQLDTHYIFSITILEQVATHQFSFDQFKKHFRLRSLKEMHQKFIEVFSFRNDISQRRETVESLLTLLSNYFSCTIPLHLIELQEKKVLKDVHLNPDYHVYKALPDFSEKIKKLAEKQLKQTIIIDYIACQENIEVSNHDITSYLYLSLRPRTKEFLYFNLPDTKKHGQEQPVPLEWLKRYCLREKTLNYILHHLAKKN